MKNIFGKYYIIILIIFLSTDTSFSQTPRTAAINNGAKFKNSPEVSRFLDTLEYKTFLYFIDESNQENGLVKDRSTKNSPASIAAVGFALPAYAVGVQHCWISRKEAAQRTLNTLNFF